MVPATESYFEIHAREKLNDRRFLRWAVVGAALVHIALLMLRIPEVRRHLVEEEAPELFVVRPVRFKPPEPPAPELIPHEPPVRRVPVPDPTPERVEPLAVVRLEPIEASFEALTDWLGEPPVPPVPADATAPVHVGPGMIPPVKIHAPSPYYTEVARKARREGTVLLQAVIDKRGSVTDVKVLRGLGLGLDQVTVETIRRWLFEPARLPDGRPVAVYYTLTVQFRLN